VDRVTGLESPPADWETEPTDFGGQLVRHRHKDVTAVCYVYSNPNGAWAECTICGADLVLQKPTAPAIGYSAAGKVTYEQ
jgi:hypothetical protein